MNPPPFRSGCRHYQHGQLYHKVSIITRTVLSQGQCYHKVSVITRSVLSQGQYYHKVSVVTAVMAPDLLLKLR